MWVGGGKEGCCAQLSEDMTTGGKEMLTYTDTDEEEQVEVEGRDLLDCSGQLWEREERHVNRETYLTPHLPKESGKHLLPEHHKVWLDVLCDREFIHIVGT